MSNSFNISVKPEISAVKTVVDANSVILVDVHDTDLPAAVTKIDANKTVIDENKVILVDVHDTDLPGAVTKIDANKTEIDAIRAEDVLNIRIDLQTNETKIDANTNTLQAVHTSVGFTISASDDLLFSADTERSVLGTSWTKVKEIRIDYSGTYRFTFNTKVDGVNIGFAKIYEGGTPYGNEHDFNNNSYPNAISEDLVFTAGQLAQLYLKNGGGADTTFAKEFRVKGVLDTVIEPVIID